MNRCSTYSVSNRGHCHPPLRGGGMKGGMKWLEDRTLQCCFGLTMGCFCLVERCVCVWKELLEVCVTERNRRKERERGKVTLWKYCHPPHKDRETDTHTQNLWTVLWPSTDLSLYLVHLSTGNLLILLSTHHSVQLLSLCSSKLHRKLALSAIVIPCLRSIWRLKWSQNESVCKIKVELLQKSMYEIRGQHTKLNS